jgi:6-phosphogluconate dehydrogenase
MQLIAEAYDILHRGAAIAPDALSRIFANWNSGPLESFLIEITAKILSLRDRETGQALVDLVLDKAGQKGTGRWTAEEALALGVPAPTIAAAIDARVISSMKEERRAVAEKLGGKREIAFRGNKERLIEDVQRALYASRICAYAQGMSLIRAGSKEYGWRIGLAEVARIWKGGCIIRAALLDPIRRALGRRKAPSNLLLDRKLGSEVRRARPAWQRVLGAAQKLGIPVPAMSASIAYFDAYRSERLPQNLIQAQRDAFGAHTYERTDQPERGPIHTDWLKDEPER